MKQDGMLETGTFGGGGPGLDPPLVLFGCEDWVNRSGYWYAQNSMIITDRLVIQITLQCFCEARNLGETSIRLKDLGEVRLLSLRKIIIILQ
jgi:hypothetical protein